MAVWFLLLCLMCIWSFKYAKGRACVFLGFSLSSCIDAWMQSRGVGVFCSFPGKIILVFSFQVCFGRSNTFLLGLCISSFVKVCLRCRTLCLCGK